MSLKGYVVGQGRTSTRTTLPPGGASSVSLGEPTSGPSKPPSEAGSYAVSLSGMSQTSTATPHLLAAAGLPSQREQPVNGRGVDAVKLQIIQRLSAVSSEADLVRALQQVLKEVSGDDDGVDKQDLEALATGNAGGGAVEAAAGEALAVLRSHLRASGSHACQALATRLRQANADSSGALSYEEALRAVGPLVGEPGLHALFRSLDPACTGRLPAAALLDALRGPLPDHRRNLVLLAFGALDKEGNGTAEVRDLLAAYDVAAHPDVRSGARGQAGVLADLLAGLDSANGGAAERVTTADILSYYTDVSVCVEDDEAFEALVHEAWHLARPLAVRRVLASQADGTTSVVPLPAEVPLERFDQDVALAQLARAGVEAVSAAPYGGTSAPLVAEVRPAGRPSGPPSPALAGAPPMTPAEEIRHRQRTSNIIF